MRKLLAIAAMAALTPAVSMAVTGPGQYSVNGFQQICLQAGNTWYGTTFSAWGGTWSSVGKDTLIHGNYAAGVGNDAMSFKLKAGVNKGNWQEWRDDLSFDTYIRGATLTFVKFACDPPATESARGVNPME
jgi:hypothetical protein